MGGSVATAFKNV